MRYAKVASAVLGTGLLAVSGFAVSGCDSCSKFKDEYPGGKYEYATADGKDKTEVRLEENFFVLAVQCQTSAKDAVNAALSKAAHDAGNGSVSELGKKDSPETKAYGAFGRSVPFKGQTLPLTFKTKLELDGVNLGEELYVEWRGVPSQQNAAPRKLKLNNFDKAGAALPGYPTLVPQGGKYLLEVPKDYAGDNQPVMIVGSFLKEREIGGGFCFGNPVPFAIKSATGGDKEITIKGHAEADDVIDCKADEIVLFAVSGFKGDPRDMLCHLLSKEVVTQQGNVQFQLNLMNVWLRGTSSKSSSTVLVEATAEWSNEEGIYKTGTATLMPGVFSNDKKDAAAFDKGEHAPGDFYIEVIVEPSTKKVTAKIHAYLEKDKIPDEVKLTVPLTPYSGGGERTLQKTVPLSSPKK